MPAPHRRPLADLRLLQWPAAVRAGGAATAVRAQLLHEIARCAVRGEEVAQRGAAAGDGVFEDAPYRVGEQAVALARDLAGGAQRRDAGGKKRLGGVESGSATRLKSTHECTTR